MRNIKLIIQYDGTDYSGWQRQSGTRRTVSGVIEGALRKITRQDVKLIAAGRTDAGVHARGQTANFFTSSAIETARLLRSLNALLPEDIRVIEAREVPVDFNSRYSPRSKTYRYTILNRRTCDVFSRRYVYHCPLARLNTAAMRQAASALVGKHDFVSFKRADKKKRGTVRDLESIKLTERGNLIFIDVTAKSFLYHMVRNIAGTLIEVGKGNLAPESLKAILAAKDRKLAGPTAPACGLCLIKVRY